MPGAASDSKNAATCVELKGFRSKSSPLCNQIRRTITARKYITKNLQDANISNDIECAISKSAISSSIVMMGLKYSLDKGTINNPIIE